MQEPKEKFVERMQELLKDETDLQAYLETLKTQAPTSIRCNTLKIQPK